MQFQACKLIQECTYTYKNRFVFKVIADILRHLFT